MPRRPRKTRRLASAGWRIALVVTALAAAIAGSATLLPPTANPSDPAALTARIIAGLAISGGVVALIALLTRRADRSRLSDAGFARPGSGWRLASWGAGVWLVPAAAGFGVLALLGMPLTVAAPAGEVARTILLLFLAVLLTEALPEEAIFRGYVTTVLGTVTTGWRIVIAQAVLFALFGAVLRQDWNPLNLSLFAVMGIGFGYLRMITGSIWMPIGFHAAFQTGAQLVLTHPVVGFTGGQDVAMLAVGTAPFAVAALVVSTTGIPRFVVPRP